MRELDLMIQLKVNYLILMFCFILQKVLHNKNYLGSISFLFKDVFDQFEQMQQWFTVFDALDDDIFDGTLGDDDTETPRVLVAFEIGEDEELTETELTMTQQDENSGIIQHQKAKSESRRVLESSKEKRDSDRDVKLTTGSVHHRSSGNHTANTNPIPKEQNHFKKHDVQSPRNPPTPPTYPNQDSKELSEKAGNRDSKKDSLKKPPSLKESLQITQAPPAETLVRRGSERGRQVDGYTEQRRSDSKNLPGRSSSPNVTPYQQVVPPLPLASIGQPARITAPQVQPASNPLLSRVQELEQQLASRDLEVEKLKLQLSTQKAVLEDQQHELQSLHKENGVLGNTLATLRQNLKKTRDELEDRVRKARDEQSEEIENELARTRERLSDSENRRAVIAMQLLNLQKEMDDLERRSTGKKVSDLKPNKTLEDENTRLVEELSRLRDVNHRINSELAETKRRLEENESETQHAILRKQLDGILKEKQAPHPQLRIVRAIICNPQAETRDEGRYEDSMGSRGISESRSNRKPNPANYRSEQGQYQPQPKEFVAPSPIIAQSEVFNDLDEDRELVTKVLEYFDRKYPGTTVSKAGKNVFEVDGVKMTFRITSGSLSVKTGGSFLPINQYFALQPLDKKRPAKAVSPAPARTPVEKYESAPRATGSSRSPVPSGTGSRRKP